MLKFKTEYYRTIAKDTNSEKTVAELCDEIDRLRGEQYDTLMGQELCKTPPHGKTVDVRVAVAVDKRGYWRAEGRPTDADILYAHVRDYMQGEHSVYWLTATLPVPEEVEVVAEVERE